MNEAKRVEVLQPQDFVIFGAAAIFAGDFTIETIPGLKVVTDFGLEPDNVLITIDDDGMLLITPRKRKGVFTALHCERGKWARVREPRLTEAPAAF